MSHAEGDPTSDDAPTRAEGPKDVAPRAPAAEPSSEEETVAAPLEGPKHDASISSSTQSTTIATPHDAMHFEEFRRTRAFARIVIPFAFAVLACLPFIGGDTGAKCVFAVGLVAIVITGLVLGRALRTDAGYSVGRALVFGVVCVVGGFAGIYYFGIFSPAVAVVPFGLYFFSVGQSYRGTLSIYLLCSALELGVGGAVIAGFLRDRGLVRADALAPVSALSIVLFVEVTFFATFLVARASRKAMLHAIEEHDRAVRGLAQREELLKEAKQDLERALEAGGLGRFTDETLGSFRLGSVIGRGGMGEVYEAVRVDTEEQAAVKLLHGHALGDPDNVRRFMREAKIAASFEIPHVVRVIEVGGLEARVPYIAMERLRGSDLADLLRQHRRLSVQKVLALIREVGRGLDAARAGGIVHRDLKPRNLFYAEVAAGRAIWKILDFGVSRLMADQATLTRDQVLGTPTYMAPEQVMSGKVDYRADLYSLGVIAYRALTGRPAFSGDQMAEILYKVMHTMPPLPSKAGRLTEDVDAVLAIAMAKDATNRFDSAAEFADALEAAARGDLSNDLRSKGARLARETPWADG